MDNGVSSIIEELYDDFRERSSEVKRYVSFVQTLADSKATGLSSGEGENKAVVEGFELDRDLTKTIRASAYLLLYNLVESTLSNAVDSIHQVIDNNSIEYDQLNRNIREITLKNFRNAIGNRKDNPLDSAHPIQLAVVKMGYKKEDLFSGNIDCREIRDVSKRYGFTVPDPKLNGRSIGAYVLEVKTRRNQLAHGALSFEACGRDAIPEHIITVTEQTIIYLRAVLWSISYYLRTKGYRCVEETE